MEAPPPTKTITRRRVLSQVERNWTRLAQRGAPCRARSWSHKMEDRPAPVPSKSPFPGRKIPRVEDESKSATYSAGRRGTVNEYEIAIRTFFSSNTRYKLYMQQDALCVTESFWNCWNEGLGFCRNWDRRTFHQKGFNQVFFCTSSHLHRSFYKLETKAMDTKMTC